MKTFLPHDSANAIQVEFERTADRLQEAHGREMALPMEVVLLQVPMSDIDDLLPDGGAAFILAFHTDIHSVAYIDEEGTLIEIDYLATREQAAKR